MPAGVGYEPTPCRIASQAFTAPRPEIARPLSHGGKYELDLLTQQMMLLLCHTAKRFHVHAIQMYLYHVVYC